MTEERRVDRRDIEMAHAGGPIPEILGGALVGALLLLCVAAVVLRGAVPSEAAIAIGALAGALVSWVYRPDRITLERQRDVLHALTPEERPHRRAA
jgi:hypothetical protein